MTKDEKELLLFWANKRANEATKLKQDIILQDDPMTEFYQGQYMAFCEVYSMINHMHINEDYD